MQSTSLNEAELVQHHKDTSVQFESHLKVY